MHARLNPDKNEQASGDTERKRNDEDFNRLAAIVEYSDDAIISKNLKDAVTSWNPAAERMFGYSKADIIGKPVQILLPQDRLHEEAEISAVIVIGEDVQHLETVRMRKGGQCFHVSMTVSPIKDSAGRIVGISKIVRDITKRKLAEQALLESNARFHALFECMLEGYAHCRIIFEEGEARDFVYLEVNTAFEKLTGLKNVVGKKVSEVIPGIQEAHPELFPIYKRVSLSGKPEKYDTYLESLGIWLSTTIYSNEKEHFVAVFDNITERKKIEAENSFKEQRYRLLVEATTSIVWDTPASGEFEVEQAGWAAFTGQSFEEYRGWGWLNAIHPGDQAETKRIWAAAFAGRATYKAEHRLLDRNGKYHNMAVRAVPIQDEDGMILQWFGVHTDITENKRAEARFHRLTESDVQGDIFWNINGEITGANDAFLRMVGYTRKELEDQRINWVAITPPEHAYLDHKAMREISTTGACAPYEKEFIRKDGSRIPVLLGAAIFDDNPEEGVCFVLDLTERKRLESQLLQSQKMETVGKLAGGIAHEFNSILTSIIGHSELMLEDLREDTPLALKAKDINRAAMRAAGLTRQLLAYGRKQILNPTLLNLNLVIKNMEDSLRHLMGHNSNVVFAPAKGLKTVKADLRQIEEVITNMALNARDAMAHGGTLTLETSNVQLDESYVRRFPESKAGDYVMLIVADTGTGMTAEISSRAFEPFFTTKGVGQGAGLGLSTSHGIIQQSGGHVSVESVPGRGSSFKIYLPQSELEDPPSPKRLSSPNLPRGTETVLLVESDPLLLEIAEMFLGQLGYTVISAATGAEAISKSNDHGGGSINVLLTDFMLSDMSGNELSGKVQRLHPHTKTLYALAPNDITQTQPGALQDAGTYLLKPYTPSCACPENARHLKSLNGSLVACL